VVPVSSGCGEWALIAYRLVAIKVSITFCKFHGSRIHLGYETDRFSNFAAWRIEASDMWRRKTLT
jgi:hypothetical protein